MDNENFSYINLARNILFVAENTECTAERLGSHEEASITFKRAAEFHGELVEAIDNTLHKGQIRPAYSLLRTLLEVCTGFSWLADDFENRFEQYSTGKLPKINRMMSSANLGWSTEYSISYSSLSNFVHGSYIHSDINKEAAIYKAEEKVPYTLSSDLFILQTDDGDRLLHICDRNQEDLIREHKSFMDIKVFDIVITFLMRASGSYSDSFNWWPGKEAMENFNEAIKMIDRDHYFLWPTEKKRLSINKMEGRYT